MCELFYYFYSFIIYCCRAPNVLTQNHYCVGYFCLLNYFEHLFQSITVYDNIIAEEGISTLIIVINEDNILII